MFSNAHRVTIETILDNIASGVTDEVNPRKGSAAPLSTSRASLGKAWSVLNKWALDILLDQGSIEVPNFIRVGWQRFRATDGKIRLRPVFILSDGFCRAHDIPHKRLLRRPLFKKAAEVVNFTKLAIRHTTYMTKSMIYVALREIICGIGTAMASGGEVNITFSFGTLEAKDKKFRFVFDSSTLNRDKLDLGATPRASYDDGGLSFDSPRLGRDRPRSSRSTDVSNNVSDVSNNGADGEKRSDIDREAGDSCRESIAIGEGIKDKETSMIEEVKLERAREIAAVWTPKRGSGKRTVAQDKVWESCFRDYVKALEAEAEDEQALARRRRDLQLSEDKREAEKIEKNRREVCDLSVFVRGQMDERDAIRAHQLEENRENGQEPAFVVPSEKVSLAYEGLRDTAWRAPDWGPRRGRAGSVKLEDLLSTLQDQVRDRHHERHETDRCRVEAEKAILEKCLREFDEKEERQKVAKAALCQGLKESWDKQMQLKRLGFLAKTGPEAVREFASNKNIVRSEDFSSQDMPNKAGRAGWIKAGPQSLTGPSKIYVRGRCRYRAYSPPEDGGSFQSGGTCNASSRPIRRPSTTEPPAAAAEVPPAAAEVPPASSVGFDSRQSARETPRIGVKATT